MTRHQVKHFGIQVLRRIVQLAVVGCVFALVFLSLYAHYRAARAIDDLRAENGTKARILTAIDDRVSAMEDPQEFLDGFKGTLWSMRVGGVDITDPLAVAEMTAASKVVYVPLLLSALIPIVGTILLGRVFCSWICPAGLLFEVSGKARRLLGFLEVPPAAVTFSLRNKYILLLVGSLVVGAIGLPIFALIYPPAVLSRLAHAWIFGTGLTGMLVIIGLIILFELLISPRWWCRTMCPGGALYALLGWTRLLRVRLDAARCTGCGACEPVCEPGINPVAHSEGLECDNCGVCIRHCPERALFYTVGLPGRNSGTAGDAAGRSSEHRTPEPSPPSASGTNGMSILVLLAAYGLMSSPVQAHHILGLPHYSYKENYPQAPTLEYPASTGPYDVLLTSYPGKPVPGEPTNIAVYIKDRHTGRPYDQPVTVCILQTFTFGRNRIVVPATLVQPYENLHKLTATFPEEGEYVLELRMDVEGAQELIPFMMISGDPTATASVVVAIVFGLGMFLIVVRAIKIKQRRRSLAGTEAVSAPVAG